MDIQPLSIDQINQEKRKQYVKERDTKSLQEISKRICNGFCIILDIKDSTKRKKDDNHDRWIEQTRVFYNAFNTLNNRLSKINQLQLVTQKFNGDGVMSFFKDINSIATLNNQNIAPDACYEIIRKVIKFKEEIENEQALCKMKIKTVITYLTDVQVIEIGHDNKKNDVLGLGIDFSYRIGEFSDIGYIVVNNLLFKCLVSDEDNKINRGSDLHKALSPVKTDLDGLGSYSLLTVARKVKGWDKSQHFHIIVNKKMLANMIEYMRDDDQDRSIYKELLTYYCNENDEQIVQQKTNKDILHLPSGKNKF